MDAKLTADIQRWLDTPASERDIEVGATLLLKLNRNRILYNNVMRKPQKFLGKLEYELKKHLRIRLDGFTLREVALMEQQVIPAVTKVLADGAPIEPTGEVAADGQQPKYVGKRGDHDTLPEDVQALYVRNGEVWGKIKETYETLKQMEKSPACDRYEHLKVLTELEAEYRANWERYDHYDAANNVAADGSGKEISAADVTAARKYLSTNKSKLAALAEKGDEDKFLALKDKMQQRIATILTSGGTFDAEYQQSLEELGLTFA